MLVFRDKTMQRTRVLFSSWTAEMRLEDGERKRPEKREASAGARHAIILWTSVWQPMTSHEAIVPATAIVYVCVTLSRFDSHANKGE